MTATPDKRDDNLEGRNIYEIFNHQIAYEIRLQDAMEEDLLCPFHYFGITDLDIIADAGYGEYFGHGLGHSVGLFIHENPRLSPSDDTILQENMIETVEPGIYVPGLGGVRIEDMVVVTKEGHINLAHSPKELIELPVE